MPASPLSSTCSSYLWRKDQAPNLTVLQGKRDLECQVFFSLNNNITASNSITRTVILPLLLSGRNWAALCSCSDISIHLCLAFNGPICSALVSQCLHSWSIWVERFLTWELHSRSPARALSTECILGSVWLWVAWCWEVLVALRVGCCCGSPSLAGTGWRGQAGPAAQHCVIVASLWKGPCRLSVPWVHFSLQHSPPSLLQREFCG